MAIDETHDPQIESWVSSANQTSTDFPLQNLPFGRFRLKGEKSLRLGVAIGDQVLDLTSATGDLPRSMAALLELPVSNRRALRKYLWAGLQSGSKMHALWCKHLYPQTAVHLALPCDTRDYTDFYCGIHHASAVGKLFRPNQPLLPNYLHLPIAYHGRSSTLIASGTPCVRPHGQLKSAEQERPFLGPSAKLDFELEIGVMIATPNLNHHPIPIEQAEDHVLGLTLVNDWSARDIQVWEYQPLGPFLAKNFATTVSPWVITLEALAPFRTERMALARSHAPLPYLEHTLADAQVAFEISLSVWMSSIAMRDRGLAPHLIAQTDFSQSAFWSIAQMIAHHTINGCQLSAGDLLATGTLSGPLPGQTGSLIELTQDGRAPFGLPDGSPRTFLEDGDQVRFQGRCDRAGFRSIGFGVCEGEISPARTDILRKH